jgi:hypothetical protein
MKPYIKPSIEFIELRTEEQLACCRASINNMGHGTSAHICYNPNGRITGHGYDSGSGPSTVNPPAWGHCGVS